jgi:hypothetical protein
MKIRLTSKWRRDRAKPVALEENAVALAYIIWQIALMAAKNLHAEDFIYESDEQRIAVITEYLVFLVHVADRFAHADMPQEARERFVTQLAREVARHLHRNQAEILGSGDHASAFIALLNERLADYAQTAFREGRPGFECLRCLGDQVLTIMGASQVNRWVIDQVMEIDAPSAVDHLRQAMDNLFGSAAVTLPTPSEPD